MNYRHKRCISCGLILTDKRSGQPVDELFDAYALEKSNVLKLRPCFECGKDVADEYAEMDGCLIGIDVLLQYSEAYRHVLYNDEGYRKITAKTALVTLITDSYISWFFLPSSGEFFEREMLFYVTCFKSALGLLAYMSVALISSLPLVKWDTNNFITLFYGLLMAYSSRLCKLLALLWSPRNEYFMWMIIDLIFIVSSVRVGQVVTGRNVVVPIVIMACFSLFIVSHYDLIISISRCEL